MASLVRVLGAVAVLTLLVGPLGAAAEKVITIGYLEATDDPRYVERSTQARYPGQPWGRPFGGAEVAVEESQLIGAVVGVRFELQRAGAGSVDDLVAAVDHLAGRGARFFLLDAPGDVVAALGQRTRGRELLLFNVSALDDDLRRQRCQPHLLHVAPSRAMLMDALGQFLVQRKWRDVLVLKGPGPDDAAVHGAFERAARRFGLKVRDTRSFVLGRDPRERSRNNVALLTAGASYDVVFVADGHGEFARDVPYHVQKPRPVVGAAGLVPDWWHWAWERHGAPQLNGRFLRRTQRHMTGYDWSAWMAVKAVVEAVVRTGQTDFRRLADYIRSDQIVLDGFKGSRLGFRPWNNQLRQPIFLTTGNWVVERAPLEGFLHPTDNLETLGFDAKDSGCRF